MLSIVQYGLGAPSVYEGLLNVMEAVADSLVTLARLHVCLSCLFSKTSRTSAMK